MQRIANRGPFIASVILAAALLILTGRIIGSHENAVASPAEPAGVGGAPASITNFISRLAPKSTLEVIQGEKTIAPLVPAPITRSQNKIVDYKLTVRETTAKIAPNLIYSSLWTFDGVVPGPVMRVKVGDVVRLTLNNDAKSVTNHNIDFHFATGACGGCGDTAVKPGQSKTIEVRALYPGLFMYHCAYNLNGNMAAVHIANGMYGFLIVDPEVPLPTVDHEFILVESEFYVTRVGKTIGICSLPDLIAETPTHVFFNGKSAELNPPLTVAVNDRVRLYVGKGGVNGFSAFHVIGAIFDKVYPDGDTLDSPCEHGVQTVTIPSGGAAIVEFVTPVPGKLIAVDHNLSRVYFKGLGQVINVVGAPNPEIYSVVGSDPTICGAGKAASDSDPKPLQ